MRDKMKQGPRSRPAHPCSNTHQIPLTVPEGAKAGSVHSLKWSWPHGPHQMKCVLYFIWPILSTSAWVVLLNQISHLLDVKMYGSWGRPPLAVLRMNTLSFLSDVSLRITSHFSKAQI